MAITVKIQYSDDAMWGADGFEGYDVAASYENFENMVTKGVRELSADWEIEFDRGINDGVKVLCGAEFEKAQENDIRTEVQDVISNIWEDWVWAVAE